MQQNSTSKKQHRMNWPVPQNGAYEGIFATETFGSRYRTTIDMDADGKPDLVQTADPTKGQQVWDASGSPYWKVSLNTGTSFTTPINWAVPQNGLTYGFYSTAASSLNQYWSLIDITGDGKPDLVQTGDSTKGQQVWDATGSPYWKVFRNTGSGFGQVSNWLVPSSGLYDGFYAPKSNTSNRYWGTLDMNGVAHVTFTSTPEALVMQIQGAGDDVATYEDVVGRHLVRFGERDELHVSWVRSDGTAGSTQN